MSFEPLVLLSLAIVFLAALVRSTFGFADALVAMPLLTLTVGFSTARPLVALISTVFSTVVLLMDWRHVSLASAWRLTLSAVIGVPFGFLLVNMVQDVHLRFALAIVIVLFSVFSLLHPRLIRLKSDLTSYPFGFVAGILGGGVNTPGPPIAIYGTLRGWSPQQFRATFQSYALPTSMAIAIGHGINGLMTREVLWLFAFSLPAVAAAIVAGRWLNKRFNSERFQVLIYVLLIVIGVWLLADSVIKLRQSGPTTAELLVGS